MVSNISNYLRLSEGKLRKDRQELDKNEIIKEDNRTVKEEFAYEMEIIDERNCLRNKIAFYEKPLEELEMKRWEMKVIQQKWKTKL